MKKHYVLTVRSAFFSDDTSVSSFLMYHPTRTSEDLKADHAEADATRAGDGYYNLFEYVLTQLAKKGWVVVAELQNVDVTYDF